MTFIVDPPTIRASPSSGRAGSTFDIIGQGWPTNCSPTTLGFDGNSVSGPTVTVPASTPLGGRSVTEQCTSTAGRSSDTVVEARTTFTGAAAPNADVVLDDLGPDHGDDHHGHHDVAHHKVERRDDDRDHR